VTSYTKNYIELRDLLGLHFACKHCDSTLTIPIARIDRGIPSECPNCNETWSDFTSVKSAANVISEFAKAQKQLQQALYGDHPASIGYTLTIEIASDPASGGKD